MKTLTVGLPERLVAEIEAEARQRQVPKSDVVRERLREYGSGARSTKGDQDRPARQWWRRIGVTDETVLAAITPRRFWT